MQKLLSSIVFVLLMVSFASAQVANKPKMASPKDASVKLEKKLVIPPGATMPVPDSGRLVPKIIETKRPSGWLTITCHGQEWYSLMISGPCEFQTEDVVPQDWEIGAAYNDFKLNAYTLTVKVKEDTSSRNKDAVEIRKTDKDHHFLILVPKGWLYEFKRDHTR